MSNKLIPNFHASSMRTLAAKNMSDTKMKFLKEIYLYEKYGWSKKLETAELLKGINVEEESIKLHNEVHNTNYIKNTKTYKTLINCEYPFFIVGTPDIVDNNTIIDIKSSWDLDTFTSSDIKKTTNNYLYQLLTYDFLINNEELSNDSYISYCLVDTPNEFVDKKANKIFWKLKEEYKGYDNIASLENNIKVELREKHKFSEIITDKKERNKVFKIEYRKEAVNYMIENLKECSAYINQL